MRTHTPTPTHPSCYTPSLYVLVLMCWVSHDILYQTCHDRKALQTRQKYLPYQNKESLEHEITGNIRCISLWLNGIVFSDHILLINAQCVGCCFLMLTLFSLIIEMSNTPK